MNRTLLGMLGTLDNSVKADWKAYINPLVHAYNCTPHDSTNVSPYELMFGRKPKLPIDMKFDKAFTDDNTRTTREYLEDLHHRIVKTQEIVKKHIEKSQVRQKHHYNKKAKAVKIEVGDKVLVRQLSFDGKHKISDKFEEDVYIVKEQIRPDIPVYKAESEETGTVKTIHRNHLLPVNHLFDDCSSDEKEKTNDVNADQTTCDVDKSSLSREQTANGDKKERILTTSKSPRDMVSKHEISEESDEEWFEYVESRHTTGDPDTIKPSFGEREKKLYETKSPSVQEVTDSEVKGVQEAAAEDEDELDKVGILDESSIGENIANINNIDHEEVRVSLGDKPQSAKDFTCKGENSD